MSETTDQRIKKLVFDIVDTGLCLTDPKEWARKEAEYESGGRNMAHEECCVDCFYRSPDSEHHGWGWCRIREHASVSPSGGCGKHIDPREWARQEAIRELRREDELRDEEGIMEAGSDSNERGE